jgi:hypothetical protein
MEGLKNQIETSQFVNPEGFEPSTYSLEGCCSIQLSYESFFMFSGGKGKNYFKISRMIL